MKKITLLALAATILILTGCNNNSKTYTSIDEYESDMEKIKENTAYTIEATESAGTLTMKFKTYKKGDKWKTESNADSTDEKLKKQIAFMQSVIQYDGKDLIQYNTQDKIAISAIAEINKIKEEERKKFVISAQNPTAPIFDWERILNTKDANVQFGKKERKNGFECRMIKLDNKEACVSDKYGIAVYQSVSIQNPKTKQILKITNNVTKINTDNFDDSIFNLPQDMKLITLKEAREIQEKILTAATTNSK